MRNSDQNHSTIQFSFFPIVFGRFVSHLQLHLRIALILLFLQVDSIGLTEHSLVSLKLFDKLNQFFDLKILWFYLENGKMKITSLRALERHCFDLESGFYALNVLEIVVWFRSAEQIRSLEHQRFKTKKTK